VKVALLSKYEIVKSSEIKIDNSNQKRAILEVQINIQNYNLTLFVNHWKSKYNMGKESKRVEYANALMKRVKDLPKDREYIIMGDFNSDYDEYLTIKDKFNDTNSTIGINHILKTINKNTLVDRELISKKDSKLHYNLWLDIAKESRFSRRYFAYKSTIDAIILPHNMFDKRKIEYIPNSFNIFKPHYLFTKKGAINRWQFKDNRHIGEGYSDHLPIYAIFRIYQKNRKSFNINTVDDLYKINHIEKSITLRDVKVIFKRGKNAIIKESFNGRGVYIYNVASNLTEGKSYDIRIDRVDNYYGLKEITKISNIRELKDINFSKYIKIYSDSFIDNIKQNDIYRDIIGIYKKDFFYIDSKKVKIYFKERRFKPKNGSKLKLLYVQIGYYHGNYLLVHTKDDFKIINNF